jgi:hypothetical protein
LPDIIGAVVKEVVKGGKVALARTMENRYVDRKTSFDMMDIS